MIVEELCDGADGLALVNFDRALETTDPVLKLPARPLEGIVHGESDFGMALIGLRRARDIHLLAVG